MTPELPNNQKEARLTALLLGELPADEAIALGRMIEQDAELAKTFERLKKTIAFVKETETSTAGEMQKSAPIKMSAEKREALLQRFKTVKPSRLAEPERRNLRILQIAAVIAVLGLLGALLLPAISKSKSRAQRVAANKNNLQFGTWALENSAATPADATLATARNSAATRQIPESQATDFNIAAGGVVQHASPPSMGSVTFANSSLTANATRQAGKGELALNEDVAGRREGGSPQKKLPEVALSAGGGGGTGGSARNLRAPIVLPASNELAQQNTPAPEVTVSAKFVDVTQNNALSFGVNGWQPNDGNTQGQLSGDSVSGALTLDDLSKLDFGAPTESPALTNMPLAGKAFSFYTDRNRNDGLNPHASAKSSATPVDPATGLPLPMGQVGTSSVALEQRTYRLEPNVFQWFAEKPAFPPEPAAGPLTASTGGAAGGAGGILGVTRANDALALQNDARQFFATNGVILDSNKGESLYYNDKSGALYVYSTPQNQAKVRTITNSFGNSSSASSTSSIVLPASTSEFAFDAAPSAPALNYQTSTLYRDRSAAEVPRGATALMERKSGDKSQERAAAKNESGVSTNVYSLGVIGYANIAAAADSPTTLAEKETMRKLEALRIENDAEILKRMGPGAYAEAKNKLDQLQRSIEQLKVEDATADAKSAVPKTTTVEIVDAARPAPKPSTSLWGKLTGKPAEYESRAVIRVNRDVTDIPGSAANNAGVVYDPYFIQTEFEAIGSTQVLGRVVTDLGLDDKWGKDGQKLSSEKAVGKLKGMLDLKTAGTHIDLGVKDQKPDEAAEIANAVAKSYAEYRQKQANSLATSGVVALQEQIADQEQKIQEQEKVVAQLQRQLFDSGVVAAAPAQIAQNSAKDEAARQQSEDKPLPKPATPPPIPQPEIETASNPFSTFSLNVSDVSFKLTAASLEKGVLPEPASIRSEEFINAFDYRDPEPPANVPVAFASERAQYPFAQNRDLLRFSIKTAAQGREAGKPLNLVLLVDNSGSMERADRVQILRESLRVLATQLRKEDRLSVVTFARTPHLRVDGISGEQAGGAVEQVSGLTPEGGTNLEEGMNLAYQTAARHYLTNGVNRVVLMTDGAANLGDVSPDTLKQKVESNRQQGIALDCFGIGWEGYNDDLLEVLSRNGDGRYGFINTPEEASSEFASQLAGALNVAASDVKVQVEFNPKRTIAYRQMGYAKHQLTKEQFRDNTVDAAEIGAAEAGNALYVIQTNPNGEGPIATVRVRFKIPGTSDYREHEWAVAYTGAAVPLEQASPAMRLAASASAFSEWLATSPYAAEVTPDALLKYLSGVPDVYGADGRPKKLEWMVRQARALAGK